MSFPPPLSTASRSPEDLPALLPQTAPAGSDHLDRLSMAHAEASLPPNTRRAYASDWKHFRAFCLRAGRDPGIPDPRTIANYLSASAEGDRTVGHRTCSVATLQRRLTALSWVYTQLGTPLDRTDRHIATVMAGIRRTHRAPPVRKAALLPGDLKAMLATCSHGTLRGLRDRAILLLGFAGALRRSEVVAFDIVPEAKSAGTRSWIEFVPQGMILHIHGKTGFRKVEVGPGSAPDTCPVTAVQGWIAFARVTEGPLFRRITAQGRGIGPMRLCDRQVAELVKRTALAAGIRSDLPEGARAGLFSGHSLRAGFATSAEIDEGRVQRHLGHASVEMTRRYQRDHEGFKVNHTKAAGL